MHIKDSSFNVRFSMLLFKKFILLYVLCTILFFQAFLLFDFNEVYLAKNEILIMQI